MESFSILQSLCGAALHLDKSLKGSQTMQIPQYLNPNSLTIQKASRKETEDGSIQTLQAADPEGDQVNLRKWTEDTGATTMMPDTDALR